MSWQDFLDFKKNTKDFLGQDVNVSFEVMANGELRTRIKGVGGILPFSYIRVERKDGIDWENAHYHLNTKELITVEQGCQIVIEKNGNDYKLIVMKEGDVYKSNVGVSHNCLVFPNTVIHTIKTSVNKGDFENDWHEDKELDVISKKLVISRIIEEYGLEEYLAR